ncbi:hypothetical protein PFISCL1PPCAC_3147 [Pristionchus fissidentatus]|uniref:Uncharacterized protein n=1 Tax=Pristionchus fissidentatus TaxID=1538716 RepID=A0AAV5V200_9BILA|nr:hypothetical protein PFISCL1PPCAC_3147 [Pristionchus fissidentatus]
MIPWLVFLILPTIKASPPELRLMNDLFSGYVKEERPVLNHETPVMVKLGVILQQIINLNEKEEQLEVNMWLKYQWMDENLKWEPEQYENVTTLVQPAGTTWQPDVLLYNSVDNAFDSTYKVNQISNSDGTQEWMPPGIFRVSCKLDIYWFPFDVQKCLFKFGSWTFDASKLNLVAGDFDMTEFITNGEWLIESTFVNRSEKTYSCCPEIYPDLSFTMVLKRRTLYYAFNLIMPCMLTMMLVVLGFALSAESGEKIGLQITVSLAICIFLTIMNEMTPQTSESVPLLGVFFQSCMVISVLATTFTVYIQSFHFRCHQNHHRMGFWMRWLLLEWAPWLLRMRLPKRENTLSTIKQSWAERMDSDEDTKTAFDYTDGTAKMVTSVSIAMKENFDNLVFQVHVNSDVKRDRGLMKRLETLNRIYEHVKMIRENGDDGEEDERVANEWRFAAIVVDRIGLLSFTALIIVTSAILSLRAPYLFA